MVLFTKALYNLLDPIYSIKLFFALLIYSPVEFFYSSYAFRCKNISDCSSKYASIHLIGKWHFGLRSLTIFRF